MRHHRSTPTTRTARVRRLAATAAALALTSTTVAACGAEEDPEVGDQEFVGDTQPAADGDDEVGDGGDVAVASVLGLEVTAVGNVTEVLSPEALRIDRDGLGPLDDNGEIPGDFEALYDYDYYDYELLTEGDEADAAYASDEGVLVLAPEGVPAQSVDDAVRVSGTLRLFDQEALEEFYDLELDGDEYDGIDEVLVIVAQEVNSASDVPTVVQGSGGDAGA